MISGDAVAALDVKHQVAGFTFHPHITGPIPGADRHIPEHIFARFRPLNVVTIRPIYLSRCPPQNNTASDAIFSILLISFLPLMSPSLVKFDFKAKAPTIFGLDF